MVSEPSSYRRRQEGTGVQDGIDIYFSTFAATMASIGAFFAAEKPVIDFLRFTMRSRFASRCPCRIVDVGAQVRLDLLKKHPRWKARSGRMSMPPARPEGPWD
ncbi:MAG: hypothetical protein R2787_17730 [Saprospiraceae bacterium]